MLCISVLYIPQSLSKQPFSQYSTDRNQGSADMLTCDVRKWGQMFGCCRQTVDERFTVCVCGSSLTYSFYDMSK